MRALQTSSPSAATTTPSSGPAPTGRGPVVVYERPPPGMAQGLWSVPAWAVIAAGAVVIIGIVAFFVSRHRRDKAPDSSIAPSSIPPSSRR